MSNSEVTKLIKKKVRDSGYKLTAICKKTGIDYQRLQRVFHQNATLTATELIILSLFLGLDISDFTSDSRKSA